MRFLIKSGGVGGLGLIKKSHLDFELELFKGYRELEKFTFKSKNHLIIKSVNLDR